MNRNAILAGILAVLLCLGACGGGGKEPAGSSSAGLPQTGGQTQTDDSQTGGGQEALPPAPEELSPEPEAAPAIRETVLVDESGIKITAQSLSLDEMFGPELKLLIENNSGQDLTFQCRNSSVNGYMVDTMLSADVKNGKKANDGITFVQSALDQCGIATIADMAFSFHIFTSEGWDTYLDTPQIEIKTSAADTYDYTFGWERDSLIYEGEGIRILKRGMNRSMFGPQIIYYIENNSDRDVTIQVRDVSVNGFMVSTVCSVDVLAGKHAVDSLVFMDSSLEENGITELETAEWSFHIFDMESWDTIVDSEPIVTSFPPGTLEMIRNMG